MSREARTSGPAGTAAADGGWLRLARWLDVAVLAILACLVLLTPLAFGAVARWTIVTIVYAVSLATALWLMSMAARGDLRLPRTPGLVLAVLFGVWVSLQLLPLPPSAVDLLSPGTRHLLAIASPSRAGSEEALPVSLTPDDTWIALTRYLAILFAGLLTASVIRTRRQATTVIWGLLLAGGFQACYGFAEYFSGHQCIFWWPRQYHLDAVAGTYHNKNHFSGLLEMMVPLGIGLLLAKAGDPGSVAMGRFRDRFIHAFSSSEIPRRLLLVFLALAMSLGIVFSLSRAGFGAFALSLLLLVMFLIGQVRFRRQTVFLVLFAGLILLIASTAGLQLVAERLEDAASGRSSSWLIRIKLCRDALPYARDFLLAGSGFGSFCAVFPHYQSAYFGDLLTDYLHNDWLQLLTETGIVGTVLLSGAIGVAVSRILRTALFRRSAFAKWLGIGATVGTVAMLIHSFFDYNLYKMTSNALVFSTLLGLGYAAAHLASPGGTDQYERSAYLHVSLSPSLRAALVSLAISLPISLRVMPGMSLSDALSIGKLQYAVAKPDPYFFLPAAAVDDIPLNDIAAREGGVSAEHSHLLALDQIDQAEALVRRRVDATITNLLGTDLAATDPKGHQQLVARLLPDVRLAMCGERRPYLERALQHVGAALGRRQTDYTYHRLRLEILAELGADPESLLRALQAAYLLTPHRPRTLFLIGRVLLDSLPPLDLNTPIDATDFVPPDQLTPDTYHTADALYAALFCFRRAIYGHPTRYARRVYALVDRLAEGSALLCAVTPTNIVAQEQLVVALWDRRAYEAMLPCLDAIEKLATADSLSANASEQWHVEQAPDEPAPPAALAEDDDTLAASSRRRTPQDAMYRVWQRRAQVYALLGRWPERLDAVAHFRVYLRQRCDEELEEARQLRYQGRLREAYLQVRHVLERDWGHPDALLEAAELSLLPNVLTPQDHHQQPLDHLYRLVIAALPGLLPDATLVRTSAVHDGLRLSSSQCDRLCHVLKSVSPTTEKARSRQAFIEAASWCLVGQPRDALRVLQASVDREGSYASWEQGHLAPYVCGLSWELLGESEKAIACYAETLSILPNMRPAAIRFEQLSDSGSEVGDGYTGPLGGNLTPGAPVGVVYHAGSEGALVLLGMSSAKNGSVVLVWQMLTGISGDEAPIVKFYDADLKYAAYYRMSTQEIAQMCDEAKCGGVVSHEIVPVRSPIAQSGEQDVVYFELRFPHCPVFGRLRDDCTKREPTARLLLPRRMQL